MSSFDAVVEMEGQPDREADATATGSGEFTTMTTQATVPDVGRVEEWLAARNLTVSEAALLINTVSMAVIAISLAWEVRNR